MNKILKGTYTYYSESPQEEIDLMNSVLNNVNISDTSILNITSKVLELPFNEQVHFVHGVLDKIYHLTNDSEENKNIEKFLAQSTFEIHRDVIMALVEYYETSNDKMNEISKLENLLNLKIIDSNE